MRKKKKVSTFQAAVKKQVDGGKGGERETVDYAHLRHEAYQARRERKLAVGEGREKWRGTRPGDER